MGLRGRTNVCIKGQNLNFYLETHATPHNIHATPHNIYFIRLRILPRILGTLYWRMYVCMYVKRSPLLLTNSVFSLILLLALRVSWKSTGDSQVHTGLLCFPWRGKLFCHFLFLYTLLYRHIRVVQLQTNRIYYYNLCNKLGTGIESSPRYKWHAMNLELHTFSPSWLKDRKSRLFKKNRAHFFNSKT